LSDLNSIEETFSKIKGILRRAEARTCEALVETLGAISTVTVRGACGYEAPQVLSLRKFL